MNISSVFSKEYIKTADQSALLSVGKDIWKAVVTAHLVIA